MSGFTLGASVWNFSGLADADIAPLADGLRPFTEEDTIPFTAYYSELIDAILSSDIELVELSYIDALYQKAVMDQVERLSAAGRIWSIHAPFAQHLDLSSNDENVRQNGIAACKKAADVLHLAKGKVLVVHASSVASLPADLDDRIRNSASSLHDIACHCKNLGLMVAVEILVRPNLGDTDEEIIKLCDMANCSNIGYNIDVNHVFPPDRLVQTIHNLGNKLITLHISDYDGERERHWMPMEGIINWKEAYKALEEVNYSGPFLYEARIPAAGVKDAVSKMMDNYAKIRSL